MRDQRTLHRSVTVVATRPVERDGRRLNEAFVWTRAAGYRAVRRKRYLPDEPGAYERTWYEPGEGDFPAVDVDGATVGVLICTEIMFNRHARDLGRTGAHLVAVPRATGNHERWPVAARMTAIASGAFVASANRRGADEALFGGAGWIIGPDGEVLAATTRAEPFRTLDLDLAAAERAKGTYPRSVPG
jgi:N-carbamoylputrescine amidase